MEGFTIAAILASALAFFTVAGVLYFRSPKEELWIIAFAILIQLPMCWLVYDFIREPIFSKLALWLGKDSLPFLSLKIFDAPLFEELGKYSPLLLPFFRKRIRQENAIRVAMALGLGFGLGEIWFLHHKLGTGAGVAGKPWYYFSAFINERFLVCIGHGVFVATGLRLYHSHFLKGILLGMLLHCLANFPIFLKIIDLGSLGPQVWTIILVIYVQIYFLGLIGLLGYYTFGGKGFLKLMMGENSLCNTCATEFKSSLKRINLLHKRYEHCPHCNRFRMCSVVPKKGVISEEVASQNQ